MFPLPLLLWLSPAFPVGAFAYSHGLEWAVEAGDITNAATLANWLEGLMLYGSGRTDAVLLAAAWHGASQQDSARLGTVNELALALSPSRERHLETLSQGNAFMLAALASWPCAALDRLKATAPQGVAYPAALGAAMAGHDLALQPCVEAFCMGFLGNLVSAAVRLGPIGQTEAQKILVRLVAPVQTLAQDIAALPLDRQRQSLDLCLGSCTLRFDIASLRHETQYSRLFRS